jgi:hypothetical protein
MTDTTLPSPGTTARFDLDTGDSYIGEVVEIGRDLAVLQNYSAWYEGADEPYSSKYFDDQVSFRVNAKTRIAQF